MPAKAAGSTRLAEAAEAATDALTAAGCSSPRLDVELLLEAATGMDRSRLISSADAPLEPEAGRRFAAMVRRRSTREPVAYILGRKGFRRIELAVDKRVLIPRPETELLVEIALELQPRRVADVGTGSGAIALAIADELPDATVDATDTSPGALEVAGTNARLLALSDRVTITAGTLPASGPFDLIVSNLPYVSDAEWATLEPEILKHEPPEALLAGADGLDAIRTLLDAGPDCTTLALEHGDTQGEAVRALLTDAGFADAETRQDLAGLDRVTLGHRQ